MRCCDGSWISSTTLKHIRREPSKQNGLGTILEIQTQTLMEMELGERGAYQCEARMCDMALAKILRIACST